MSRLPLVLLAAWPALVSLGCRGDETKVDPTAGLPFGDRGLEVGTFAMVSDRSDTVWFAAHPTGSRLLQLVRSRHSAGRLDSVSVIVDARSKAPIESHHHVHTPEGSLTADVRYGAGFEGQARLTLATAEGELVDNLRTPAPYLDAGQIPLVFASLRLAAGDTLVFSYIAPFEKRALNAQLIIEAIDTLDLPARPTAAYPVRLRVSGLEERFWFAAPPSPPDLLRWGEITRGVTWTRVGP